MQQTIPSSRNLLADRAIAASAFTALLLLFIALSIARHWPLIVDAPLMHYIVFLMSKNFVPYRDIIDMNMPGSYIVDGLVMHTLGGGSGAWFLWDLMSVAVAVLASVWIVGPHRRLSGLLAGCLAGLMHLADGAWDMGQRDWTVAVLLLLSFACLAHFARHHREIWISISMLCAGIAATIKPPALLFAFVGLALICWPHRSSTKRLVPLVLWAILGLAPPFLLILVFLTAYHIGDSFLFTMRGLVPYYASTQKVGLRYMFWQVLTNREKLFGFVTLASMALFWANKSWRSVEAQLILAGSVCGAVSYIVQAKGFTYHRYPVIIFLSLLIATQVANSLRLHGRPFALALLVIVLLPVIGILSIRREQSQGTPTLDTSLHLQEDLVRLGGAQLSGRVQCLDMTWAGCINTLYRMGLVQTTGFIYDFYLFPERNTPLTESLQERFLREINAAPPKVLVLSQQVWPGDFLSYDQVNRWPKFSSFLRERYNLVEEYPRKAGDPGGYRLYLLR